MKTRDKFLLLVGLFCTNLMYGDAVDMFARGLKSIQGIMVEAHLAVDKKDKNNKYIDGTHDTFKFKSGGPKDVTIHVIIGDVLGQKAQAVVNAANVELIGGGGMDKLIEKKAKESMGAGVDVVGLHWKSGKPDDWGTGKAFLNTALRLPGEVKVIQTAGPVCSEIMDDEKKEQLSNSYYNSLTAAEQNDIATIAFPLISSGIFGCDSYDAYLASAKGVFNYFVTHPDSKITDVYIVMFYTKGPSDKNDPDTRFRFWSEQVVKDWIKDVGGNFIRK